MALNKVQMTQENGHQKGSLESPARNWASPKEPTKEPITRIEFLGKRRMKETHCAPKGIETLELKLTNLQEKIRGILVRGGKQKDKDDWEAFRVHPSQKKNKKKNKK